MKKQIGCVVMASGLSVRFGSNKLLAEFQGRTLLQTALDLTEGLFERRVVVTRTEAAAELCRGQGIEVILHSLPGRNDAVRLGVERLEDMDALVFCPCDQPLLRRESLSRMLTQPDIREDSILRLAWGEKVGTPTLFGREYFPLLRDLPEKTGGGYVIRRFRDRVRLVPVEDERELWDVDTPEDLARFVSLAVVRHD